MNLKKLTQKEIELAYIREEITEEEYNNYLTEEERRIRTTTKDYDRR